MSITAQTTRPAAVAAYSMKKSYRDKTVLAGVDLTIAEGEVLALLGPNGAGKTTTVQILSTLIPADGGTATVLGHDLRREAGRDPRRDRRHRPVLRCRRPAHRPRRTCC